MVVVAVVYVECTSYAAMGDSNGRYLSSQLFYDCLWVNEFFLFVFLGVRRDEDKFTV